MRYARVQAVLDQEPAFVAKMGERTETVFKPTGEKQMFSPEAIAVTQAIHNAGKDAHKVHKTEIIRYAVQVFKIGQKATPPPVNGAAVAVPPPAPPAPPTQEPIVVKAPAPVPADPKPAKASAKPAPKPKTPPPAAAAVVAAPEVPPEAPKVVAPAPTGESENRDAALQKAKETLNPERPGENPAAFNAYISMYSMSLTLIQLVELYDNQPGKDKRYKALDELAKEFNKFTSIKSAKEAQKAKS